MDYLERAEEQISHASDFTAERKRKSQSRCLGLLTLLNGVGLTAGAVFLVTLFLIPAGLSGYGTLLVVYALVSIPVFLLRFSFRQRSFSPLQIAVISFAPALLCLYAPFLITGQTGMSLVTGGYFFLCTLLYVVITDEVRRHSSLDAAFQARMNKALTGPGVAIGGIVSVFCASFEMWSVMECLPLAGAICSLVPVLLDRRCTCRSEADSEHAGGEIISSCTALLRNLPRLPLAFWLLVASVVAAPIVALHDCVALLLLTKAGLEPRITAAVLGLIAALGGALFHAGMLFIDPRIVMRFGVRDVYMLFPSSGILLPVAALATGGPALAALLPVNRYAVKSMTYDESCYVIAENLPSSMKARLEILSVCIATPCAFLLSGALICVIAGTDLNGTVLSVMASLICILFFYVSFRVRKEYISSLVSLFKERNTDILTVAKGFGRKVAFEYSVILEGLRGSDDRACLFILNSLKKIMPSSMEKPLLELLPQKSTAVKALILQLLGDNGAEGAQAEIRKYLKSPHPVLRARAFEALRKIDCKAHRDDFIEGLDDEDPEARAQAAAALILDRVSGESGLAVIRDMITSENRDWACWGAYAAGLTTEKSFFYYLVPLLSSPSFSVRLKAIEAMEKLIDYKNGELMPVIRKALQDKAPAVRIIAMNILASFGNNGIVELFAPLLGDRSVTVRNEAVAILAKCGESVVEEMRSFLYEKDERTVESALRVLSSLDTRSALDFVYRFLHVEFTYSYRNVQMRSVLERCEGDRELLICALRDNTRKTFHHAFIVLQALREKRRSKKNHAYPFHQNGSGGELLHAFLGGMEERVSQFLVPFMEYDEQKERLQAVSTRLKRPLPSIEELCEEGVHHPDPWVGEATFYFLEMTGRSSLFAHERGRFKYADEGGRKVLEEILILKKIPLFMNLNMELLKDISEITEEKHYYAGQIVFEEGDIGDEMYLIYSGKVKIFKRGKNREEIVLSELGEKGYFGEMALLDDAPRSASAMVLESAVLSVLTREKLYAIIYEKPEIAIEVCRILSSRLRDANDRLQGALQGDTGKAIT